MCIIKTFKLPGSIAMTQLVRRFLNLKCVKTHIDSPWHGFHLVRLQLCKFSLGNSQYGSLNLMVIILDQSRQTYTKQ